jgi:uncharacterized protein (DUF952 family)
MGAQPLLHVAIADDWESSRRFGEYEASTRGQTLDDVGYIHATTEAGLAAVLDEIYGDLDLPLVVVVIDSDALRASGIDVRAGESATDPGSGWRIHGPLPMGSEVIRAEISLARIDHHWVPPNLA